MLEGSGGGRIQERKNLIVCPLYNMSYNAFTGKKRVESLNDFQMICHLHSVTECLHIMLCK